MVVGGAGFETMTMRMWMDLRYGMVLVVLIPAADHVLLAPKWV
jgi:hypothetical protein